MQSRFKLRCAFGGINDNLLMVGGEDAKVYVWDRDDKSPLTILSAHAGPINDVAWSGKVMVTVSDDMSLRAWVSLDSKVTVE